MMRTLLAINWLNLNKGSKMRMKFIHWRKCFLDLIKMHGAHSEFERDDIIALRERWRMGKIR